MFDNARTVLTQLAEEVNTLEADRSSSNRGKMVEMGHKLIAIRAVLREQNGEILGGFAAADGRTPIGWVQWVGENLTITPNSAARCLRLALDPMAIEKKRVKGTEGNYTPAGAAQRARKAWPTWTQEQREQFSALVLKILDTP